MEIVLVTRDLRKTYPDGTVAVRGVALTLARGELLGFVGPNGAGKTTTLRLLTGAARPTGGTVEIFGKEFSPDRVEIKRRIGYVPSDDSFFEHLTAIEQVYLSARVYGVAGETAKGRIKDLFELLELPSGDGKRIRELSHGTRRKIAMACALVHDPEIIFLDEPLEGLDVLTARALKETFQWMATSGRAIVLTSHNLALIGDVCQRVAVIDRGEIRFDGPMREHQTLASGAASNLEEGFLEVIGRAPRSSRLAWIKPSEQEKPN
jgi:ABC-2 type transport system ATP-binding protein